MEWPKLKNIILFILVLTNLGLLAFVASRELQNSRQQQQTRQAAIQYLADREITVAEAQVPDEMSLMPQTAKRDLQQEADLAARLLGKDLQEENRGAGVYRYFNDNGFIQFHGDGAIQAQFAPGVFPMGEDRAQACLQVLEQLEFEGVLLREEGDQLIFCQQWKGQPLFTQQVTLEVTEGSVAAIPTGRRLVGEPVEDASRSTISVSTALIRFYNGINSLGDVCSRIDSITPGYGATPALSGPMTLTPVWRITTDTRTYQLDLVSGTLARVA